MTTLTLTGFLGRDREIRDTTPRSWTYERYDPIVDEQVEVDASSRSREYAVLSLATQRPVNGRWTTEWHRVIAWNVDRMDKVSVRLARKGDRVEITGRPETYTYTTADGQVHEVQQVVLDNLRFLKKKVRRELA